MKFQTIDLEEFTPVEPKHGGGIMGRPLAPMTEALLRGDKVFTSEEQQKWRSYRKTLAARGKKLAWQPGIYKGEQGFLVWAVSAEEETNSHQQEPERGPRQSRQRQEGK